MRWFLVGIVFFCLFSTNLAFADENESDKVNVIFQVVNPMENPVPLLWETSYLERKYSGDSSYECERLVTIYSDDSDPSTVDFGSEYCVDINTVMVAGRSTKALYSSRDPEANSFVLQVPEGYHEVRFPEAIRVKGQYYLVNEPTRNWPLEEGGVIGLVVIPTSRVEVHYPLESDQYSKDGYYALEVDGAPLIFDQSTVHYMHPGNYRLVWVPKEAPIEAKDRPCPVTRTDSVPDSISDRLLEMTVPDNLSRCLPNESLEASYSYTDNKISYHLVRTTPDPGPEPTPPEDTDVKLYVNCMEAEVGSVIKISLEHPTVILIDWDFRQSTYCQER